MKTERKMRISIESMFAVSLLIIGLVSVSGMAFGTETERSYLDGNALMVTGTAREGKYADETRDWEQGDFVAFRLSKDAWFYILYGTDEHPNSIMMATFQLRYLGGATVKDSSGNTIVEKIGIPVVTIYGHKFFTFIEFQDVGYRETDMFFEEQGEKVGAGNDLWDFRRTHEGIENMDNSFVYTEPVIKALDLNTSWTRSNIGEVSYDDPNVKGFDFSLSAYDLEYGDGDGKVWDPDFEADGTNATRLEEVTFTFHINITVEEDVEINNIPWYEVEISVGDGDKPELKNTRSAGERNFKGVAVNAEYKYDHYIRGWDFKDPGNDSKLMLECFTVFGTFIPDIVNEWFDKQFVENIDGALGVVQYEYENAGNLVDATIGEPEDIPEQPMLIAKERITFKDNWHRVGELSWISDVEVDGRPEEMVYQVHAGQNQQNRSDKDDGHFHALVILGGYIYPAGGDIFHDPTFSCSALIIEGLSGITLNILSSTGTCLQAVVAVVAVGIGVTIFVVRRIRRKKDNAE